MIQVLSNLITYIIPSNWYTTMKICDMVNKICDTLIILKWFVFPTLIILCLTVVGVGYFWCKVKLKGGK
jgi:hypothetical protein